MRAASGLHTPITRSGHADDHPVPPRTPGQFRKLHAVAVLTARLLPAPRNRGPACYLVFRSARAADCLCFPLQDNRSRLPVSRPACGRARSGPLALGSALLSVGSVAGLCSASRAGQQPSGRRCPYRREDRRIRSQTRESLQTCRRAAPRSSQPPPAATPRHASRCYGSRDAGRAGAACCGGGCQCRAGSDVDDIPAAVCHRYHSRSCGSPGFAGWRNRRTHVSRLALHRDE